MTIAINLHLDAFGRLVLVDEAGREHVGVAPIRAFPLSDRSRFISLCDGQGREIVQIADLAALPEEARRVLEAELAQQEFLPVVRRIVRISSEAEPAQWDVETDRGPTSFTLKSEDDVHRLAQHRAILVDAQGLRYLVADSRQLDSYSRRVLEQYI